MNQLKKKPGRKLGWRKDPSKPDYVPKYDKPGQPPKNDDKISYSIRIREHPEVMALLRDSFGSIQVMWEELAKNLMK